MPLNRTSPGNDPEGRVTVEPARGVSAPAGLILKPVKFGVRAEFLYYSEPDTGI